MTRAAARTSSDAQHRQQAGHGRTSGGHGGGTAELNGQDVSHGASNPLY
jgi:hypothetical protein